MRVLIRTDASLQIGTGHVMRCLTLARELRAQGGEVVFASREHEGHLGDMLESEGFPVLRLPLLAWEPVKGALKHAAWLGCDWQLDAAQVEASLREAGGAWDLLIVDHYALDARWERRLRSLFRCVLTIDDLADREHDCDLLLDQNLMPDASTRYEGLVPRACERLLGPRFALLRPEFRDQRERLARRTGRVRRLSVCFGGVDPTNETAKVLRALRGVRGEPFGIEVITGRHNPHLAELQALVSELPDASLVVEAADMARRFAQADLALGAAGSTSWERACLGLPALLIAVAHNQEAIGQGLASAGAAIYLGPSGRVSEDAIRSEVERWQTQPDALRSMGSRAFDLVDGLGARRVATRLRKDVVA